MILRSGIFRSESTKVSNGIGVMDRVVTYKQRTYSRVSVY